MRPRPPGPSRPHLNHPPTGRTDCSLPHLVPPQPRVQLESDMRGRFLCSGVSMVTQQEFTQSPCPHRRGPGAPRRRCEQGRDSNLRGAGPLRPTWAQVALPLTSTQVIQPQRRGQQGPILVHQRGNGPLPESAVLSQDTKQIH